MFYPVLILGLEEKITLLVMSLIVFLVEARPPLHSKNLNGKSRQLLLYKLRCCWSYLV